MKQVTSEAIINSLRRDLHRSQQELVAEDVDVALAGLHLRLLRRDVDKEAGALLH